MKQDMLMIALMKIVVQKAGLVTVLQIVKTRLMVVTLPVMTMTVVTVKAAATVELAAAAQTVNHVIMILPLMAANAVILHGMNMVLIVLH